MSIFQKKNRYVILECPLYNNNAYELICVYALNITRSWHNECMDTFL